MGAGSGGGNLFLIPAVTEGPVTRDSGMLFPLALLHSVSTCSPLGPFLAPGMHTLSRGWMHGAGMER